MRGLFKITYDLYTKDKILNEDKKIAYPISTNLLTNDGFVNISNICPNQQVFCEDGMLHTVTTIKSEGLQDIYKITLSDRTTFECCGNHLITYQQQSDKCIDRYRFAACNEILSMPLYQQTKRGDKNWKIFLPITKPLNFESLNNLPIHPYIIGVLLGDGSLSDSETHKGSVTFTNGEADIANKVSNLLDEHFFLNKVNTSDNNSGYYIINDRERSKLGYNRFKEKMKLLNLTGHNAYTKFIPDMYKYASIHNRIQLLYGLIDTDGNVTNSMSYEYSTSSKQLCDDICFVLQSIGCTVTVSSRIPKYTYKGETHTGHLSYRLNIKPPNNLILCSSEKHLNKLTKKSNTTSNRSIRSIEYIGQKESFKIITDNPSLLLVTDNCIVY